MTSPSPHGRPNFVLKAPITMKASMPNSFAVEQDPRKQSTMRLKHAIHQSLTPPPFFPSTAECLFGHRWRDKPAGRLWLRLRGMRC